jgi:hypothetical protein
MSLNDLDRIEYEALRATIRERGTARLCAVLAGLTAWGALGVALRATDLSGTVTLVPFVVLAATFEINFFVHTGVERIGRYIQVFFEERSGAAGWETTAMNYGARFSAPQASGGGLDPLFSVVFFAAALVNFLSSLVVDDSHPGWIALSLAAHLAFNYRIVRARQFSATQRALDLERFRNLANER